MISLPLLDETQIEFYIPENVDIPLCIRHSLTVLLL